MSKIKNEDLDKANAELELRRRRERQELESKYDWRSIARGKQIAPDGDWRIWMILAGRGFGKRSSIYDDIRTRGGWKKLRDIKKGDVIFDNMGRSCNVIKAHPIIESNAYKLFFDSGETIICDPEHLWRTISIYDEKKNNPNPKPDGQIRTTEEIVNSLKYGKRTNHKIPVCRPLAFSKKELPIKPYTFGYWLGRGYWRAMTIYIPPNDKVEIIKNIEKEGYETRKYNITHHPEVYGIHEKRTDSNMTAYLRELKVYGKRFVPWQYKNSSIQQRLSFLQGLLDARSYWRKGGLCTFSTSHKEFMDDVCEILSSLGIKIRRSIKNNGLEYKLTYMISFFTELKIVTLEKKDKIRCAVNKNRLHMAEYRYITKAEKIEKHFMRCLTVDSPDHLFLITKSFIATHNTRASSEWAREQINKTKYPTRGALVGRTPADVRDVMIEGESGILNISPPWNMPKYEPSKRRLTWPNGSVASTYSFENPDQLRGPQHHWAIVDELASAPNENTWDNLMFGMRLGDHPQIMISTTPRPTNLIKRLVKETDIIITSGSTYENADNLSPSFLKAIEEKYANTRLGRQEIHAEILEDVEGALWTAAIIERNKIPYKTFDKNQMVRIVVAVDPSASSNKDSDETGIIVVGLGKDQFGYILDDGSLIGTPNERAHQIKRLFYKWEADYIVAEKNNGGDMVEHMIKTVDIENKMKVKLVWASRGKFTRAEPIAALNEQDKIKYVVHKNNLALLEDELCSWQPGMSISPNRLDAMVWGCSELMLNKVSAPIFIGL